MAKRGGLSDLLRRFPPKQVKADQLLVFDSFSSFDVNKWHQYGKELSSYAYKVFFGYEAQRANVYDELRSALLETATQGWSATQWHRITSAEYHALSSQGSLKWLGGRFNFGKRIDELRFQPFPALYLASDRDTATREVYKKTSEEAATDLLNPYELALKDPRSIIWAVVDIQLSLIFDLTSECNLAPFVKIMKDFEPADGVHEVAARLGLPKLVTIKDTKTMLTNLLKSDFEIEPTIGDHPSNSQVFGKLIKDAGIEGILYPSVRGDGKCLAIFPENLGAGSYVRFSGQPPFGVLPIQLDATNFATL